MNLQKALRASAALALFTLATPFALAEHRDGHGGGWYGGFNAGESQATIDDERIIRGLLADGFTTTSLSEEDRDTGFKVFGGYRFNRHFALEASYFDLGQFGFTANTEPPGTLTGEVEFKGGSLDLVGILPFTQRLYAFGRAGANYAEAESHFAGTGAVTVPDPDRDDSGVNYKAGLGLGFDFTPHFGLRAEAERYRVDDSVGNKGDVDLFSAGLVFGFGQVEAPRRAPVVTAPPPVAATPAPPPPLPVPARRVTFSADALFDFGKATLKPAGKQALNAFINELSGTSFDVISITGYTDRIGTDDYNMDLSRQRAESVKAYLELARIPSRQLSARGAGESSPVTGGQCQGQEKPKASTALKACLAPDRRVEVEVTGSKAPGQ